MDIRPQDTVVVLKAGEVIPQIFEVVKEKRPAESQPLNIETSLQEQNIQAKLENNKWISIDGETKKIQQLIYYSQKLKIAYLGKSLIKQLVQDGTVKDACDLYALLPEQLACYISIGPKKASKIFDNIQATRNCSFSRWLTGCGIPLVGPQTVSFVSEKCSNFEDFISLVQNENVLIKNLGRKTALSLCQWFVANADFVQYFSTFHFVFQQQQKRDKMNLPLFGRNYVITGKFQEATREDIRQHLTNLGAIVQQKMNKKTHYLMVGKVPSQSKVSIAEKTGVEILFEEDFLNLIKKEKTNS